MILASEVNRQIEKLESHGIDVYKEDYVLIAHPSVTFLGSDLFPVEIVTDDTAPYGTAFLAKRLTIQQVIKNEE